MSKKKISYSAWDKYLTCPKMYDLHYNKRLRPKGISSPLVFGVAVDEALNVLLLTGELDKSIQTFRDKMKWEDMTDVHWDPRDTDPSIAERQDGWSDDQYAWACMRVKGRMLIEEYYRKIYPLIEEVESVQKDLQSRPGVIDAIVKLRGHGRVLLDNKTAARPYQPDAIAASTQLALYARDQQITKVGFAVLVKQIQKNTVRTCLSCSFDGSLVRHKTCPNIVNGLRCHGEWDESHSPKAVVQLMVEDIPSNLGELAHDSMCQTEKAIEHEVYPRNLRACGKVYGKPCQYIDYCWKGDDSMLEYKEETPKKEKK
jgi:hypothetical protein